MEHTLFNKGDLKIWQRLPVEVSLVILLVATIALGFERALLVWFVSFLFLLWLMENTQPIVDWRAWVYLALPLTIVLNRWVVRVAMVLLLVWIWWTGGNIILAVPVVGAMIFLLPMIGFFLKIPLRKLPRIPIGQV
jgi:hypothetical protein